MKADLTHLPENKQRELTDIVATIRECHRAVEMIILFGSFARGDWVEEKADDGVHYKYRSDYDLLIITEKEYHAMKIEQDGVLYNTMRSVSKTPISLIAHNIDFFNRRLRKGQYFFTDIQKEGICLYDSGKFERAEPRELEPRERQVLAQKDFEYWFEKAEKLLKGHQFYFTEGDMNEAAFLLHQVAERLLAGVLLVYTRYKPNTHDLKDLYSLVNSIDNAFLSIFPQSTEEETLCFELLRKAYVDARYKPNYAITSEQLHWLAERVCALKSLGEQRCRQKIASFTGNT